MKRIKKVILFIILLFVIFLIFILPLRLALKGEPIYLIQDSFGHFTFCNTTEYILGCKIEKNYQGGRTISESSKGNDLSTAIKKYNGKENIVIIAMGTNDMPILHSDSISINDVDKSLRNAITHIRNNNDKAQIILVSPINRTKDFDENSMNRIRNCIKQVATENGLYYINGSHFPFPNKTNIPLIFNNNDGLHPSIRVGCLLYDTAILIEMYKLIILNV